MSLLERVRTKEDPEPDPYSGRLGAGSRASEDDHGRGASTSLRPRARQPTVGSCVLFAPGRGTGRRQTPPGSGRPASEVSGLEGAGSAASGPSDCGTGAGAAHHPQYMAIKSRVTQALLEEFTDVVEAPRERLVAKIGELCN